MSADALN